ncbi:T9SS type A sorting domain-containing protein [Cryomorpha ignava]|uniref:T9SS type A sorting domain-containing protein n=1 Tax=Cryomorpha ignava TaxID=101383 RepID=A0A7K3WTX5_9FLAO|nr:T9SS type A sorting domain-containing protein [Cryomorpha ignava]NEN25130.1 T9SS type A sorting domain-containing protein [Cryomorpha ignava]
MTISGDYGQQDFGFATPLVLSGSVIPGINAVNFDVSSILSTFNSIDTYYFTAELSVTCSNGDESGINKFYISAFSLLNDPGIDFGDLFFKPFTYLADGTGFIQDSYIAVPAAEFPEEIEDISVFIDLGHTFNGDLSVELISPQGASVTLLTWPNGLGGNMGFSVIFEDGQPNIGSTGTVLQGFFSPSESLSVLEGLNPEGVWVVRVTDNLGMDDGMLFAVSLIINSSPCESSIQGTAYYDLNSNSTQDESESGYGNALINNSLDAQNIFASTTGHFSDCSQSGSGILSILNPPLYYSAPDVSFTVNTGDILDNLDFALAPTPGIEDLQIDLFASTADRPGFSSEYMVYYENIGTECIDNVSINLDLDNLLLITAASNGDVSFSENTAVLSIPQICPFEGGMFSVTAYLNDTVSIGTELESTAQILPVADDENSSDNVSTYPSTVVGSYDPNDKAVSHSTIHPDFNSGDEPLKYMVRFQNTGTYYAERVLIVDTLDSNLDLNSFMVVSASHDVNVTRNGNVYYFEFDQIFLPDSTANEPESHGFIRYEVNPLPGMADGESIENTAYIFFDFNAPIVTNTVSTVMDFASAIAEITYEAKVYPNPATSEINLEWASGIQINTVKLFDVAGREIATYSVNGSERLSIPVDKLGAGLYTFQFMSDVLVKPVVWMKN